MDRRREEKGLSMRRSQTKSSKFEGWVVVCGVEESWVLAGRARGKDAGR